MNREHVSTAELVGRLGKPPELQYTQEQAPYVRLTVATAERFTDKGGEIRERTEWHNAVAWGQVAEDIARDFSKGDSVALTGSLRINSYEKDGLKNRVTELHVDKAEKNLDHALSKNDARLVGVVREEPKTRTLENGTAMTMLSIATNTTVNGKGGTSREREDWHNVTLWGKTAEAARDIHAGDNIAINGTLRHRTVPGDDGRERRVSSIDCQKFQVLERAQTREQGMREPTPRAPEPERSERRRTRGKHDRARVPNATCKPTAGRTFCLSDAPGVLRRWSAMRLFIAEKPSLARAIADALPGPARRRDGYFQCGRDDQVAWCAGHILEPAPPDAYDSKFKQWRIEHLPIAPAEWKLAVSAPDLLKTIKALLAHAARVVHAGDPDREGQLLVDEVLAYLNFRGPVDRLLINDLNPSAVRRAIESIQPNAEFKTLYDAALGRQRADWLYGLNMTRLYTVLGRACGYDGVLSVGRVQTPLLGLIVRRDLEIEHFVPRTYFTIQADVVAEGRQFAAIWQPGTGAESALDSEGRLVSSDMAAEIERRTSSQTGTVTNATREHKADAPPLPYSLADLQVDAGRLLGLDPKQVVDICQSLYETGRLITYPRSDCPYLPQGHFGQGPDVLRAITSVDPKLGPFAAEADLRLRSRAWNDAKVTAHHALIPTPRTTIQSSLSANQRNVYELIARRYLAQFFPAFEYEQIQIEVDIIGERFVAKGRAPLVLGWHRVLQPVEKERQAEESDDGGPDERAPDSPLPFVDPGHRVSALRVKTVGRKTKPPRRFSPSSLIQAMTGIARYVSDPRIKQLLRETDGIGTPATQASMIQTLFDRRYIEATRRQIVSTSTGRALIRALPDVATQPDMTALWEATLRRIHDGEVSLESFLDAVRSQLRELVNRGSKTGSLDLSNVSSSSGRGMGRRARRASIKQRPRHN